MDNNRTRICFCYLITTILIAGFIYALVITNMQNSKKLYRLREEIDEIAHMILHSPTFEKQESKQLTEVVDTLIKKRLAGIWDDLYTVKKQLKSQECAALIGCRKHEGAVGEKVAEDRVNYAAEDLGAKIVACEAIPICDTSLISSMLGLDFSSNPPVNMIRPSMEPGSCFAFKNNISEVTIKLAKEIFIEVIEVQHILKGSSPTADVDSAPKTFAVYGKKVLKGDNDALLGTFEFDNTKCVQQYPVKHVAKLVYVRFKFLSNHGNPNFTCVYRVSVYGKST